MAKKTYYEVLCLRRGCSQDEIRKAYRNLVRAHHPDLHPDDAGATRRAQEINEAYETLSDPVRQAAYDRQLAREEALARAREAPRYSPEPTRVPPRRRPTPTTRPLPADWEDEELLQYIPRRRTDPFSLLFDQMEDEFDWGFYRMRGLLRRLLR